MESRAVVLQNKGEKAVFIKKSVPNLLNNQILVKVSYSSLNYKDALSILGKASIAKKYPIVVGLDLSGTVIESTARSFKKGDRVLIQGAGLGEGTDGGFCEIGVFDASLAQHIPSGLSLKQVMQIGTAGFTAALSVKKLLDNHQKPEDGPILITGASGGVGSFVTTFLSQQSYHVIAVTSNYKNESYLKELGAKIVLDIKDLPTGASGLATPMYAGAVDNLGGDTLSNILKYVDTFGSVVSVGMVSGIGFSSTVLPHIIRGVNLLGVSSTNCPQHLRVEIWRELAEIYNFYFLDKVSSLEVGLHDVIKKSEELLNNDFSGRVLIKVGEE